MLCISKAGHELQNEATLDYSGTLPAEMTDSLFMQTIRAVFPMMGILQTETSVRN